MLAADFDPAWAVYQATNDSTLFNDSARMIVQLTRESSNELTSVADVRTFFDAMHGAEVLYGLGIPGQFAIALEHETVGACLAGSASFEWMQRDTTVGGFATPDDPEFDSQHGLSNSAQNGGTVGADIDAKLAWEITTGSLANVAAVIDTGIEYTHPDLFGNIWLNQGEIPATLRTSLTDTDTDGLITFRDLNQSANSAFVSDINSNSFIDAGDLLADPRWENGVDEDGNSFVDDLIGWDFRNNDNDPLDDHRHGTHVSGVLGAKGNNGIGIAGVSWDVQLMPLKFLDQTNNGSTIDAIRAIRYATMMRQDFGVNIKASNNSWGSLEKPDLALRGAISEHGDADILFIAGAGNGTVFGQGIDLDADSRGFFPASFDLSNVISVAASDTDDEIAFFSNFGATSVDVSAPGVGIFSTLPGGSYGSRNGTSMATPHVTGAALLVWANLPDATMSEVRLAILGSTDAVAGSGDRLSTGGRLNANAALQLDTFSPRAKLIDASDITVDQTTPQVIEINFTDNRQLDVTTIDASAIFVTRRSDPETQLAVSLEAIPSQSPTLVRAFFALPAPGGSWGNEDNDVFDVHVASNRIQDANGNVSSGGLLGSFAVDVRFTGEIMVTDFADGADANPTDGDSLTVDGRSTLRSAIQTANSLPGENTIVLSEGIYVLSLPGANEDLTASGDLDVTDKLTIIGNRSVIDADSIDRIFDVFGGAELHLRGVTITGGSAVGNGGAVRTNSATVSIESSTLHDNSATGNGGAIYASDGSLTLLNTTVSGNRATVGAGLDLSSTNNADLLHVTIANNVSTTSVGGIRGAGSVSIRNTIVAENDAPTNPDVGGVFTSRGHNLIGVGGSAIGFANGISSDQVGKVGLPLDPRLGPLTQNDGGLPVHVPASDSPAIDSGDNTDTANQDARGIIRPQDANQDRSVTVDIGAVEKFFGTINGTIFVDRDGDGSQHVAVDGPFTGIQDMTAVGDTLFFTFDDGVHGRELWKVNRFGARLVRDLAPGPSGSNPQDLIEFNGKLFFSADSASFGNELFLSDGTFDGTLLAVDVRSGPQSSNPHNLAATDDFVYFAADDGIHGIELWTSDGTTDGSRLIRDVASGLADSLPDNIVQVSGAVAFTADDGTMGREVWVTNGTAQGTRMITDVNPQGSSDASDLVSLNDSLFFVAQDSSGQRQLLRSDLPYFTVSAVSGSALANAPEPSELTGTVDRLLFAANGTNGRELFETESPFQQATQVADINVGAASSTPDQLTTLGDNVFFVANDGSSGRELWRFEGNSGDVSQVIDLRDGATGSTPSSLIVLNGGLLFSADDGVTGAELWSMNRSGQVLQVNNIRSGSAGSNPTDLVNVNGTAYFLASDSASTPQLWSSRATIGDARQFVDMDEPGIVGQTVYLDLNDDGVLGASEPRAVTIDDDLQTPNANEAGRFEFPFSPPESYTVRLAGGADGSFSVPVAPEFANVFDASTLLAENGGAGSNGVVLERGAGQLLSAGTAGDFNGDGLDDLLLNYITNNQPDSLRTIVVFGDSRNSRFDQLLDAVIAGDESAGTVISDGTTHQARTFSSVGDFNGDGFDDIVSRSALIFGGDEFGPQFDVSQLREQNGGNGLRGTHFPTLEDPFFVHRAPIGDINGDGFDDLAVADSTSDTLEVAGAGRIYIVYGSADPLPAELDLDSLVDGDGRTGFVIEGDVSSRSAGITIGSAGDINFDGLSDLIIGSNNSEGFVIYGSNQQFPSVFALADLRPNAGGDGSKGFVLRSVPNVGEGTNNQIGGREKLGDFNGDGIDDLLSGTTFEARIVLGPTDATTPEFRAEQEFTSDLAKGFTVHQFGTVNAVGDFNADGVSDIVFGEVGTIKFPFVTNEIDRTNVANAYILFGRRDGDFSDILAADGDDGSFDQFSISLADYLEGGLADGNAGLQIRGISDRNGSLGSTSQSPPSTSVSSAGDINGDGADDLLFFGANLNAGAGRLYLIYGQPIDVARPSDGKYEVELKIGSTVTGLAFGQVAQPGEIRGQVFRDLNNDSEKDAGEVGIAGVQVYIDRNDNGVPDEGELLVQTDSSGRYSFAGLEAGTEHVVRQLAPTGAIQTLPVQSDSFSYRVELVSGQVAASLDFGNHDLINGVGAADIQGLIFDDANSNGNLDLTESGVPGVTVYVDLDRDSMFDPSEPTAISDGSGIYRFSGLGAGVYNVRALVTPDKRFSTPRGSEFSVQTLSTGEAPQAIKSGLINNDSFPDLVVANYETNSLSVLLNNGNGEFTSIAEITVGSGPTSIAIGDIDGNGSNDLVVGHQLSNFVGVLNNDGNGNFGSLRQINAGDGPRAVELVAFDQRNGLDIIVANQFSDDVSVLSNAGDGTFTLASTIPVGRDPTSVAIGNLDNQFGPDIVVTNSTDGNVTIIRNSTGNTNFPPTTINSGSVPFSLTTADIDQDGNADLAIANTGSDTVSVFFGRGNGTFDSALELPAGTGPSSVTTADLEGDGRIDLLVTNASTQKLAVLRGLGFRTFQSPENFGVGQISTTLAWDAVAADLDANGTIDVAVANGDGDAISILSNRLVDGTFRISVEGDESILGVNFGVTDVVTTPETFIVLSGDGTKLSIASLSDAQLAVLQSVDIRGSGNNTLVLSAEKIRALVPNQILAIISNKGDTITFGDGWIYGGSEVTSGKRHRIFQNGPATVRVLGPLDWTNPYIPGDVNGSGSVTAGDALDIIFGLNQPELTSPNGKLVDAATVNASSFRFIDPNEDGASTAADALFVINVLFQESFSATSEGEVVDVQSDLMTRTGINLQPELEAAAEHLLSTEEEKVPKSDQSQSVVPVTKLVDPLSIVDGDRDTLGLDDELSDLDHSLATVWNWIE